MSFSRLHQRLQRSEVLHNRQAVLTLLANLSEQPARKGYKKVAPFMPYRPPPTSVFSNGSVQAREESNGDADEVSGSGDRAGAGYLSSVHQIRHNLTPAAASRDNKGSYHPPVPPKPKSPISVLKSKSASEASKAKANKTKIGSSKERPLLRELVYTFQGIEGTLIKRDRHSDKFCLVPSFAKTLSPSVVQICQRLSELGWLFNKVRRFCDETAEDSDVGLSGQALVTAIKNELSEYYQLLSTLEVQAADAESEDASLHHLCVWTMDPTNRMKLLASICDACRGKRGGVLVSAIYDFLPHGDKTSSDLVRALLTTACNPMYLMLLRWICDGTLEDPHEEFFIAADPRVSGERLWGEKYSVREEMIPKFLTLAWVRKIMATGKSINFLHEVCHDSSPITGRDVVKAMLDETSPESLFSDPQGDNVLHRYIIWCFPTILPSCFKFLFLLFRRTIQRAFADTSSHVLGILFSKYKFQEHMSALRKYLLLGKQHFDISFKASCCKDS